jgi:hypothetical protein
LANKDKRRFFPDVSFLTTSTKGDCIPFESAPLVKGYFATPESRNK